MKNSLIIFAAILSVVLLSYDVPKGWFRAGSASQKYDMGVDKGSGKNGKNAATIKSIAESNGFGTLMQNSLPGKYLGKRVRMKGFMKSENVEGLAGFWFRVDQKNSTESLSFDNMTDRAVRGTTEWHEYEIVLDVPANASNIAYGALLSGTGQIWFDDIDFEIVDNSVKTTGSYPGNFDEPHNLNFED